MQWCMYVTFVNTFVNSQIHLYNCQLSISLYVCVCLIAYDY